MTTPEKLIANDQKVLVIGWDAADWRVIRPMIAEGKMPNLQKMMEEGVHGNNSTLNPVLSPMLWTSMSTGKRPYKHGIHGFSEPTPDGKSIRPISNVNRKSKAIWNMLNQVGKKCNVVGWWPSHPAEPIDGVMVSNLYQTARNIKNADIDPEIGKPRPDTVGWKADQWEMPAGTVHPSRLAKSLQEFRFHPLELDAEHVGPFIPKFSEIDQEDERVVGFAKTLSDTVSIHGAATALMQLEPWDFMAVYYDGIDHFGHGFMKYHPPRQSWIKEEDFEIYSGVVEGGYRFHDMMLGALLHLAGEETTVILVSDHGFHPDHLRPEHIPVEPAGPAIEHRPYGIFVAKGPGIKKNETISAASVLDLAPTVLSIFGLPVGEDMDGKPLSTIFEETPEIATVPSWDDVDGPHPDGRHPDGMHIDSVQSAEAMKQLVELGYIEEPNEDTDEAVRETTRELSYNLAQAYMDGGRVQEGAVILEEIWSDWPRENRFGLNLIACLGALGKVEERGMAIATLANNIRNGVEWALEELERIRPEATEYGISLPKPKPKPKPSPESPDESELNDGDVEMATPDESTEGESKKKEAPKKLTFQIRKILSHLHPMGPTLRWLSMQQSLATGDHERARKVLESIASEDKNVDRPDLLVMMADSWFTIGDLDAAHDLYLRALTLDDESSGANLGLARVAVAKEDWEQGIERALATTELIFATPLAHFLLAQSLEGMGDDEHAKIAYGVTIRLAPGLVDARERFILLLDRLGLEAEVKLHREALEEIQDSRAIDIAIEKDDVDRVAEEILHSRISRREQLDFTGNSTIAATQSPVVVVSGLPRSGTSMMMQMLEKAGIPAFADQQREADEDNPRGYFEHEKSIQIARDVSWVPEARGHAVKIVAQLLNHLPRGERYRVVFMDRDLRETVRSQRVMLDRMGRQGGRLTDARMMSTLDAQVAQIERLLARRPDIEAIFVDYASVLADPKAEASRISSFLGVDSDTDAMAAGVDGSLRRQSVQKPESDSE
ncbi:MAG: alkaline phosphatase family protein [Planctomycetota bacterium]|nr:alkaline phosphatase family protein [Planctomycetota bacterium]MDA1025177.1 alkaline phosphatase family protein [Planctomycetota bacterium]